jgi:hypothetical protein
MTTDITTTLVTGASSLSGLTVSSSTPYVYGYSSSAISGCVLTNGNYYSYPSSFPTLIKTKFTEEGEHFFFSVPGCTKENVFVTYLEQDSFFKVEAKLEDVFVSSPCRIQVNTDKFDLSNLECSIKNGLLKVFVPYFEEAKPRSVKIN